VPQRTPALVICQLNLRVFQEKSMRNLLCLLMLTGASAAIVGCSSKEPAPPAADTNTDLGTQGNIDKGNPDSSGSTSK
jgi:hypothetical protein